MWMVMNDSRYENIAPTDTEPGQGFEIILWDIIYPI